ncbi:MAG: hypothetical protein INQ03_03655 [Candidatus Heimdallarchaeota archaeon]|nr:hypothetical protein [Candidatus Heimdallarchaeota archaeon]
MDCRLLRFNNEKWQDSELFEGVKFKAFRIDNKLLRLVKFPQGFVEPKWCTNKHIGIVISGRFKLQFTDVEMDYQPLDSFILNSDHIIHAVEESVLFLIDED